MATLSYTQTDTSNLPNNAPARRLTALTRLYDVAQAVVAELDTNEARSELVRLGRHFGFVEKVTRVRKTDEVAGPGKVAK